MRPGAGICLYVLECKSRLRESLRERVRAGRETWDRAKLLVPANRRKHFNHHLILSPFRKKLASPLFWINTFEMSFILAALDKLTYFLSLIAFCVSLSNSWLKWEIIHLIWSGFGNFGGYFQLIASGLWQLCSLGCIIDMPQLRMLWKRTTLSMFFLLSEMRITDLKCLYIYTYLRTEEFLNNWKDETFSKVCLEVKWVCFNLCRCYWWKTNPYENKRMLQHSVLRICHFLLLALCIFASEDFDWTKNEMGSFQYGTFPSGKALLITANNTYKQQQI